MTYCYKNCIGCEFCIDGDYYNPSECNAEECVFEKEENTNENGNL